MLSLADFLKGSAISKSAFARRLTERMGERITPQTVHRWTLPKDDPDYSVPGRRRVEAIEQETEGKVAPASWYGAGTKRARRARPQAVSVAAARKAAATRSRQKEARA